MNKDEAEAFIKRHASLREVPFVPELELYQGREITPIWQELEDRLGETDLPPPFWAYVWPGGQAFGRYILDFPELVRGLRVLDFACGSGAGAIAACLAGAERVAGADIDPLALASLSLNAAHNGVVVEALADIDLSKPVKGYDLVMAGDVCYEHLMSHRVMRWLMLCKEKGIRVLVADPGRGYAPDRTPDPLKLKELVTYTVPVSREIEEEATRRVKIWELV